MDQSADEKPSCGDDCACHTPGVARREFLQLLGVGVAAALAARVPAMAGPFDRADFDKLVPPDKKLTPQWIKSLFDRGKPTIYRGDELKFIGMPVGGLCAGQLYLGGDGKLWHWDIFNSLISTADGHYAHPQPPDFPLEQAFTLKIAGTTRPLDATGFSDVTFSGQYPIGTVTYRDPRCPLAVTMEAFSPFIPLSADDSSLPATILTFTLHNSSNAPVDATLTGILENAVCLNNRTKSGLRVNHVVAGDGVTLLNCSVESEKQNTNPNQPARPDIVFEDWNKQKYDGWTTEGNAFGKGPIKKSDMPAYQGDVGGDTDRVVNSHASAPGADVNEKDNATGKLTSKPFTIQLNQIHFWIGGGNHPNKTCINLIVDDKIARTATGRDNNRMALASWDVRPFVGKRAILQIIDDQQGGWGNIGIGKISFSDKPLQTASLTALPDFGTMTLALLGKPPEESTGDASVDLAAKLVGHLGRRLTLAPSSSATVTFLLTWHFPNQELDGVRGSNGRYYASRFKNAPAVAEYVADNLDRLAGQTRLWRDTWYDSSLPFWFLDRTHQSISTLATSTAHRFADGRFYGWEGVGCCAGTCTHVWQYEQAMGRLFPELDILLRERADFNPAISFAPDGMIDHRGEFRAGEAIDGQTGTILRAYRDHLTSPDSAFLKRNWAAIKKAAQWLINQDGNNDGILEGAQHNTLDAEWYGPVAWLSGMYLASLRAAEEMATDAGDSQFVAACRAIFKAGSKNIVDRLFNGEYFMNQPDPKHANAINSGTGCEIDQVLGQSWGWQVALGRIVPQEQTRKALQSLWLYNFTPDVGPYRRADAPGRWYAMPGEAGLLMCTFPRSDWNYAKASGKGPNWAAGYFNECMNGFEHQAAGHMIWEGLVQEGLAVERAIHDRYHASRRNPWNEVECGDHYARSMASYGVFIAACGFEYHGPRGHIAFAPRLTPENFKSAFTAAQGWGTYTQQIERNKLTATLNIKHGSLRLKSLTLTQPQGTTVATAKLTYNDQPLSCAMTPENGRTRLTLERDTTIDTNGVLKAVMEF